MEEQLNRDQILSTAPLWCCLLLLTAATMTPAIQLPEQTPAPDEIRVSSQRTFPSPPTPFAWRPSWWIWWLRCAMDMAARFPV